MHGARHAEKFEFIAWNEFIASNHFYLTMWIFLKLKNEPYFTNVYLYR